MFSSLRSRLWLTYALTIMTALFVVAVIFIIYLWGNPFVYRQTRLRLAVVQAELLSSQSTWAALPPAKLQAELESQDAKLDARLLVLTPKREVIADSRAGKAAGLETRALFRLVKLNQTVNDVDGQPWLFVARRLDNDNLLVSAVPRPKVSFWNVLTDELLPPMEWGAALALLLALFIAYWMARWVADPLQRVVNATQEFSGGDAQPLPLQGPKEVKDLVGAFNQMTIRVQASQIAQREFVANVSHELKTPLTSIQGFSQALLDGTAAKPEEQKQAAQTIFDEAGRMHRMVLDLLDLARLDAGIADFKRVPVDLPALLNAAVQRFSPQARSAGVQLVIQLPEMLTLIGDGDRLAQVFNNLIDNALKFTSENGTVTINATKCPASSTGAAGEAVEVSIKDNGSGIASQLLPHIFDRFFQADASRQGGKKHGAGLGLAIAHEIVRAHGGKIRVQSFPGQGSEFIVWLPIINPDASTLVHRKK
jgi:signal transduction histidine kinase